jgi:hypothetical protein
MVLEQLITLAYGFCNGFSSPILPILLLVTHVRPWRAQNKTSYFLEVGEERLRGNGEEGKIIELEAQVKSYEDEKG